jgi:hypothetical protein
MFDVAIDSRLGGCGIVKIKIGDLVSGGRVRLRAIVIANAANTAPAQMVCVINWEHIAYTTARRQIYPE